MKNIICSLFGHNIRGLNTKRFFGHCIRCKKGLKVSYDMSYGETTVTGDYGNQTTFCWCECGNELCSTDSFVSDTFKDGKSLVRYRCSKCGQGQFWDFDPPTPIFVSNF